jgi:hypothetical protein
MEVKRRKMVWVERQDFNGWVCSACAWVFNTAGPPVGESIDEMINHYVHRRDNAFKSHVCAEYPKAKSPKR